MIRVAIVSVLLSACGGSIQVSSDDVVTLDASTEATGDASMDTMDATDDSPTLACCHFIGAIRCDVPCRNGTCDVDGAVGRCQ